MLENVKESNPLILIAGIICIPVAVAAASLWVDTRIDERQRTLAEELHQRQEALAVAQTIDAYFQGVGQVLLSEMDSALRDRLIVARTNALLGRLHRPGDRALVVRFVNQMQPELTKRPERALERSARPFIDLSGMDLSGTDLAFINLYRADLRGAKLRNARLTWANLSYANLREADLSGARLNGAEFHGALLSGAKLAAAGIGGASFRAARLDGADLRGADAGDFEFEGITTRTSFEAARLDGVTWLDGRVCGAGSVGECRPRD